MSSEMTKIDRSFDVHGSSFVIVGEVLPGFERVRDLFVRNFENGLEECAQVCVFVKGRKVIDAWGAMRHRQTGEPVHSYGPDSIQNVFSSSKCITSIVVAMLVDRKLLRYEQRVAEIWPEYGKLGKEATTVAQVLRHEAGLQSLATPVDLLDLTPARIRSGAVCAAMEEQKPACVPGEKRQYHLISRDWISNEIVRRVDPKGRTIGEILRDDVASPMCRPNELIIGVGDEAMGRIAPVIYRGLSWNLQQTCLPKCLGGGRAAGFHGCKGRCALGCQTGILSCVLPCAQACHNACTCGGGKKYPHGIFISSLDERTNRRFHKEGNVAIFNHPDWRRCEAPSANGHASARALAELGVAMVNGGALLGGEQLMSPDGVSNAVGNPNSKELFGVQMPFTNAGFCAFPARHGYVGWMGLGGSVLQWHPEASISFGYAGTLLEPNFQNAKAEPLQAAVLECIQTKLG